MNIEDRVAHMAKQIEAFLTHAPEDWSPKDLAGHLFGSQGQWAVLVNMELRDCVEGLLPYVEQYAEDIAKIGTAEEQESVAVAIQAAHAVLAETRFM